MAGVFVTLVLSTMLASVTAEAQDQQYTIDTFAGGAPTLPKPAPAVSVPLGFVWGIAIEAAGNVYIASYNAVFKLDQTGTLTRAAGTGRFGYSGDGGPATSAQLYAGSLATDGAGNLFIGDSFRIRRVSPNGIITTVAGNGTFCSPGQCPLGDGGPATNVSLFSVYGLAVDSVGNVFFADGNRIRRVAPSGIITTVAGNGGSSSSGDGGPAISAQLSAPQAVAVDASGNLFIAESAHIRKVSPDGIITRFAGSDGPCYPSISAADCLGDGGPATRARFQAFAMVFDSAGNLLIADGIYRRVRKISPGGIITTVAGEGFGDLAAPIQGGFSGDGGPAASAQLDCMRSLAVDGPGNVFIADSCNRRIRKVSLDGIIDTVAGNGGDVDLFSGDGGPATSAQLRRPFDVAVDGSGNVFIADSENNRVRKVAPNGTITTVAGNGTPPCYATATRDCPPNGDGGPATSAPVSAFGVAVDGSGNLFIAGGSANTGDFVDSRVRKVAPDGTITTVAGTGACCQSAGDSGPAAGAQLSGAVRVAVDRSGDLFIAETARVREVLPNGIIDTVAGNGQLGFSGDGGPARDAQLNIDYDICGPYGDGLAVDRAGDLFIADTGNARVREVSGGIINTVAGVGPQCISAPAGCPPTGVAVDNAGNLFISELSRIRKVSSDGTITTIAGKGSYGYSGDGGAAVTAELRLAQGIAVDSTGNVYVADLNNNAVRVLRPAKTSVLIGAVVDAASQRAGPVSPGKIVTIYGAGLGPSVLFNGIAATVLYSSPTQVAAVVPDAINGTSAQVTVSNNGETSAPVTVSVAPSSPGLFTLNQTGAGQAAAVDADGTVNTAAKPVKIGGFISLYATGWNDPKLPVSVTIGGIPAAIQYAGSAPGQVAGLVQVNVQIPSGVKPGGYVPVVLKVSDASTTDGAVWISVAGN